MHVKTYQLSVSVEYMINLRRGKRNWICNEMYSQELFSGFSKREMRTMGLFRRIAAAWRRDRGFSSSSFSFSNFCRNDNCLRNQCIWDIYFLCFRLTGIFPSAQMQSVLIFKDFLPAQVGMLWQIFLFPSYHISLRSWRAQLKERHCREI